MKDRLREVFLAGGEEAVRADAELMRLIAQDADAAALVAALQEIDGALAALPPFSMPRALSDAILARSEKRAWWSLPLPVLQQLELSLATLMLFLLPPLMVWMLALQRGGEATVLELSPSTVSFDMAKAIDLQSQEGESDTSFVHTADSASAQVVPRRKNPRVLADTRAALTDAHADLRARLRPQALVNAFAYDAASEPALLELEVGEAPWRRETLLVRVYVAAQVALADVDVKLSFDPERVRSFRRVAESGVGSGSAGQLAAGEGFTALYEVIASPQIGHKDALATATLRYRDASGVRQVRGSARLRDTASSDFRFASAVAWFALEARGEFGVAPRHIYERISTFAARAMPKKTRKERAHLLALCVLAADRLSTQSRRLED